MPQSESMRTLAPCSVALLLALAAAPVPAQDRVTYDLDIRDAYGNPMRPPEITTVPTASGTRSFVSTRSINGNRVRLESVTEKVVQQDAHTRVIERTVQRYDPNGNPVGLER